jgi:tetratricopeptide (TPR) repeat protein
LAIDFATAALRSGDFNEAERLLRGHLARAPNDATVLAKLAELAMRDGRTEQATLFLRRAADADRTPARYAELLRHLSRHAGAQAVLGELAVTPPSIRNFYEVRLVEAALLGSLGMHDHEIAIYEDLTKVAPRNPSLWKTLGDALKTDGRFDEAVAALRRAIECRPTYGEAYWTLANFKAFRFSDADISAMRKALKKDLKDFDALHFHFALGKALEDRKLHQQSFRHYAAGNAIRAASTNPAAMYATRYVNSAIATLTPEFFSAREGAGFPAADPIFVVGLHRSGSTLIEQILASHPMIEGTTEIMVMTQLWDRIVRAAAAAKRDPFEQLTRLDHKALADLGKEYIERTRPFRATDKPFFVDKLPSNWMNLGLIRTALPNAKIIDARRHPMACGFSNFKQNYGSGIFFSYSQESIGTFYRDYWRFMAHFDEVQPGAVHRVINERLIDDPEGQIRRLLDFIGVPFDTACLEFHNNKRAVRTPSAEQVRRPINRDGVDVWKNYEPWLGPLKASLGPALEHWDD